MTHRKANRVASIDSLRRWIKEILAETSFKENFTPHSCRSAFATKAFNINLQLFSYFEIFLCLTKFSFYHM